MGGSSVRHSSVSPAAATSPQTADRFARLERSISGGRSWPWASSSRGEDPVAGGHQLERTQHTRGLPGTSLLVAVSHAVDVKGRLVVLGEHAVGLPVVEKPGGHGVAILAVLVRAADRCEPVVGVPVGQPGPQVVVDDVVGGEVTRARSTRSVSLPDGTEGEPGHTLYHLPMGCVVDLDGVVWLAGQPIPGAAEAIALLRAAGEDVVFVTNNAGPTVEHIEAQLDAAAGIPGARSVITSAQAAAGLLEPGCAGVGGAQGKAWCRRSWPEASTSSRRHPPMPWWWASTARSTTTA